MLFLIFLCCYRRNKVAAAAKEVWPGNDIPTFRKDEKNLKKLDDLVKKLTPECSLPFFQEKAIRQHILDCLTEHRRNVKKGYNYDCVAFTLYHKLT